MQPHTIQATARAETGAPKSPAVTAKSTESELKVPDALLRALDAPSRASGAPSMVPDVASRAPDAPLVPSPDRAAPALHPGTETEPKVLAAAAKILAPAKASDASSRALDAPSKASDASSKASDAPSRASDALPKPTGASALPVSDAAAAPIAPESGASPQSASPGMTSPSEGPLRLDLSPDSDAEVPQRVALHAIGPQPAGVDSLAAVTGRAAGVKQGSHSQAAQGDCFTFACSRCPRVIACT